MSAISSERLFDEITDFLLSAPTPQAIIGFQASDALNQRLETLLNDRAAGALDATAQAELEQFLHLNHLLILLKAKARQKLQEAS
jgi:hypothetical protein